MLWQYVGTLVTVICGFAYTVLLARYLGSSQFGAIALSIGVSTLFMQLFHTNMRDFVVRYMSIGIERKEEDTLGCIATIGIATNIATMSLFYLVFFAVAAPIAGLYGQPHEFGTVIAIAALTPVFQFGLPDALTGVLRALNHVRDLALIMSAASIARLVASWMALEFFGAGIVGVLLVSSISLAAGCLVYLATVIFRLRKCGTGGPSIAGAREFLERHRPMKFVRRNYFINLLSLPTKELDTVVLGAFATLEGVGVYRMAKNFMNAVWAVADPLHLVIYPELARLWHSDSRRQVFHFIRKISVGLVLLALAIIVVSYPVVPYIIEVLVGAGFEESPTLFMIMVLSIIVWMPLCWIHPLFLASGRNDLSLRAAAIHSVVSSAIFFTLGYTGGTTGIAIAYSVNLALISGLQLAFLRRANLMSMS